MSFSDGYGIQSELRVRKILERETDWKYEFTKNDKYDVDMQLFDWGEPPCDAESRSLTGYVEIEVASESSDWQTGDIPDYWTHVSFLKRKVRCWDNRSRSWGGLHQKARQTMYLKFNHQLDNCFVASVERVFHDRAYEKTRGAASPPSKRQDVLCLPPDHDSVTWGVSDSIDAIVDHFDQVEAEQQSLTSAGSARHGDTDD
jgi:hypothetical protein